MPDYRVIYNYIDGDTQGLDLTKPENWTGTKTRVLTIEPAIGESEQSAVDDMREVKQFLLWDGGHSAIDIYDIKEFVDRDEDNNA